MGNEQAGEKVGAEGARTSSLLPVFFIQFRSEWGQHLLPPFLFVSNGGSTRCPRSFSFRTGRRYSRRPRFFPIQTGAVIFLPPPFLLF